MKSLYNYIISTNDRYNNKTSVGGKELILNTEITERDYQFVNRIGIVISTPINIKTPIKKGDQVIIHHNVFRRWHDQHGNERNSRSYFKEDQYFVAIDQIFLYKKNNEWCSLPDYCFVKPIESNSIYEDKEKPLVGIVKYTNSKIPVNKNDLIGFTPNSEYEFIIEKERLYRVLSKFITIKYEHQGKEKEYNPSWL